MTIMAFDDDQEEVIEFIDTAFFYMFSVCFPNAFFHVFSTFYYCIVDAATSSGILKAKQKLGRTFNSDKLGGIAFTKISKLTMCSA